MKKLIFFVASLFILFYFTVASASQDPYRYSQNYLGQIGYNVKTEASYKGDGIIVAVIDSGVWLEHPDLKGTNWVNDDEILGNNLDDDNNGYIDDYYGWNFIDNNHNLITKDSHGTAVAGIIAAQHNNIGIAGIAPNVKIMPLIVCDDGCSDDNIEKAIKYAVDNGADIINLSLGGRGYVGYSNYFDSVIDYAFTRDVIVIAAAGNGDIESSGNAGQNLDFLKVSPACNDGNGVNKVIGVGANTDWSNYGSCVDIIAPGEDITMLGVPLHDYEYIVNSGTSFSAPMVAAAAALIKSAYPNLKSWEVVDKLIYYDNLDIYGSLMTDGRCSLDSISHQIINYGDSIDFFGKHIFSKIRFTLVGDSIAVDINNYINQTSADKFTFHTGGLNLSPGKYSLEAKGVACNINKNITFEILPNENSEVNVEKNGKAQVSSNAQKTTSKSIDTNLSNKLRGKILLQVESHGEAWYVNPKDSKRYYMANGNEAYKIMRDLGIGITNVDLNKIKNNTIFAKKHSGKIFLQVEDLGQAYYIDFNGTAHYLKDGAAAYEVMRSLGLGISNNDLSKVEQS